MLFHLQKGKIKWEFLYICVLEFVTDVWIFLLIGLMHIDELMTYDQIGIIKQLNKIDLIY